MKPTLNSKIKIKIPSSIKGKESAAKIASIESALSFGSKIQAANMNHKDSLFGEVEESFSVEEPKLPDVENWSHKFQLAKEREALGFYLSDHPLRKFEGEFNSFSTIKLGDPTTFKNTEVVRACGVVTSVRTRIDKSGKNMAFFKLDDFTGSCECIMFGKVFSECGELIIPESTIMVTGKLESSGDAVKLHTDEVVELSKAAAKLTKTLGLQLDIERHDEQTVAKLKSILESNEGNITVMIYVKTNGKSKRYILDNKVNLNEILLGEIQNLLGDESVAYQTL